MRRIPVPTRFTVLAALILTVGQPKSPTRAQSASASDGFGKPVNGLCLRIRPIAPVAAKNFAAQYYRRYSSETKISIDIRNDSTQPIRFATSRAYGLLRVLLRDKNGRLVSIPGPVGSADKVAKLDEKDLITLGPGQSLDGAIVFLDDLKERPKPGVYQMSAALYAAAAYNFVEATRAKISTARLQIWSGTKVESLPVSLAIDESPSAGGKW